MVPLLYLLSRVKEEVKAKSSTLAKWQHHMSMMMMTSTIVNMKRGLVSINSIKHSRLL